MESPKLKVYKRRWLILAIYIICSIGSFLQMIEYGIISNIVTRYYGVPSLIVEWTSPLCAILYLVFVSPISYLINKYDLRWVLIISSGLSWLGALIKTFSVHPNRFYVIIIGKTIAAIAQTVMKLIPGKVVTQWFPFHELSTATSLATLSIQTGIMCSFLFPIIIVKNHESLDDIGNDLSYLAWTIAIFTMVGFLLVLILFQREPKQPPSETRALQKIDRERRDDKFIETIKRLLRNRKYILHCNVFGAVLGIISAMGSLINTITLEYFENTAQVAGTIGTCININCIIGGIAIGVILDKTHKYKKLSVITILLIILCYMLIVIFFFLRIEWMLYVSACLFGMFVGGYLMIGFELSIEYTYPEPENISMGISDVTINVYNIIFCIIGGILLKMYGTIPIFIGIQVLLLLSFIINVLTKIEQRRQDAKKMTEFKGLIEMIKMYNTDGLETNTRTEIS